MSRGILPLATFLRINDMKNEKNKKKKTVYIDDGSQIADMSALGRGNTQKNRGDSSYPRASFNEQFKTYKEAVKLMFLPMLAVLGIITLAFLIVYILL